MQFISVRLILFSTCETLVSTWAFFSPNPKSLLILFFSLFCKLKKKPLLGYNWHKVSCTYLKCTDVHTYISFHNKTPQTGWRRITECPLTSQSGGEKLCVSSVGSF